MSALNYENPPSDFTLYPLLWLAICFATGIFVSSIGFIEWKMYLTAVLVSAAFSIALIKTKFAPGFIALGFLALGGFYFETLKLSIPPNTIKNIYESKQIKSGDPIEIEGVLKARPELSVGGFYLKLNTKKIVYKGETRLVSGTVKLFGAVRDNRIQKEYDTLNMIRGARLRVACRLVREEKYLNPGSPSFKKILDQQGIDATASIKSPLLIERLESESSDSPIKWIYGYRQSLINHIRSNFSVSTSGVLIASLLGNRNHLTKETAEIFREGGIFHILVISGLHITFIGGGLFLLARRLFRNRISQFVFTSLILWLYSLSVGAELPVVRAALMFTILSFSMVIYRRGVLLNVLGASAFLILIWRPQDLFSQSFHLTFISLAGIVAVAFPLREKLRAIGSWMPSAKSPVPPKVPVKLKTFCEILYWSEKSWRKTLGENMWNCEIFKTRFAQQLEDRGLQKPLRWLFEGFLVTIVVQIFLLPLMVVYFHRVSFGSVFLNLWVGVLIVLQNISSILSILFGQVSGNLSLPFVKLAEVFNRVLLSAPRLFIEYDLASIRVPVYSGRMKIIYVIYFVLLSILIMFLNGWRPNSNILNYSETIRGSKKLLKRPIFWLSLSGFFLIFGLIIFHPYSSPDIDGKLTVDFLDVGQGDASLITFPNGETMLIDGGGRQNFNELTVEKADGQRESFKPDILGVGETVVSEFLWEKGYSEIDYVVVTHPDADHLLGLIPVVKNFRVRAAMIGQEALDNVDFARFDNAIKRKNVTKISLSEGDTFEIGGVYIEVLNPKSKEAQTHKSSNNNSLVLRFNFGARKFLFTGDIESETERDLLTNRALLNSDIVKVAHHGSRTSSGEEFIKATKAQFAIIPVGRKSPFGHPHQEIVDRWRRAGAKVYISGEHGTVTVSTDGKNLEVQTFIF